MKDFRKNKEGFYICEECRREFILRRCLIKHISSKHFIFKKYYDKWIKEKHEGICKICNLETSFMGLKNRPESAYKNTCSKKCENKYKQLKTEEACLKKYGIKYYLHTKEVKEKYRKTSLLKYGVDNPAKSEIIKEKTKKTNNKRYGGNAPICSRKVLEKMENSCLKKYGVKNASQNKKIKEKKVKTCIQNHKVKYGYLLKDKTKQTLLKKYGVEYPLQCKEIFDKAFKTKFNIHKYKNTNLTYQSSYELDFLNKYYDKINIENGPTIRYKYNGKNKIYFSDFYIKSRNLIIEIKSSYTLLLDEEINEKKKYSIKQGYNYLMILDKDYYNFKESVASLVGVPS